MSQVAGQLAVYARSAGLVALVGLSVVGIAIRRRALGSHTVADTIVFLGAVGTVLGAASLNLFADDTFAWNSSFLRYVLPVVVLLGPLCAVGLEWLLSAVRVRWHLLVVLCLTVPPVIAGAGGVVDGKQEHARAVTTRDEVLARVPASAVVYTGLNDKLIWPDRTTVVAPHISSWDTAWVNALGSTNSIHPYQIVAPPAAAAAQLAALTDLGDDVYVLGDGHWPSPECVSALDAELLEVGLEIFEVWHLGSDTSPADALYAVHPIDRVFS